jgi:hypothetical protein
MGAAFMSSISQPKKTWILAFAGMTDTSLLL